jgi:D-alanyl-D-alanine dipeptidase
MTWRPLLVGAALVGACAGEKNAAPQPAPPQSGPEESLAPHSASAAPVAPADLPAPAEQSAPSLLAHSRQLVVAVSEKWTSPKARLWRFEREGDAWRGKGDSWQVVLGRAGMGWGKGLHPPREMERSEPVKKEGDGRSPAGLFALGPAFGYERADGRRMPTTVSSVHHRCVDDSRSASYNKIVDERSIADKDWSSAEDMRRKDELYRHVVVVDHNHIASESAPQPGAGSCIFLHVWRRADSPTVGCTAMPVERMDQLLSWLDPGARPRLVALPASIYDEVRSSWGLPELPAAKP